MRNENRISVRLFSVANLFLFIVPGSVLLLLGPVRGVVLPDSIIRSVYPFTILPFENLFVVDVLNRAAGALVTLAEFDNVSVYLQQFFVLALVFFLLTFLFVGVQMAAGALYLDEGGPKASPSKFMITLIALLVMRSFFIFLMLANIKDLSKNEPGPEAMIVLLHAIAPESLILMTCFVAGAICVALRLAYRRITSPLA